MKNRKMMWRVLVLGLGFFVAVPLNFSQVLAGNECSALGLGNKNARHAALQAALTAAAPFGAAGKALNGGLGNYMWATLVDQDGVVCAVAFTGPTRIDQWPGSRVISAQKANTAAAFNLPAGQWWNG